MPWTRELYFGKTGLQKHIGDISSEGSKTSWRYSAKSILIHAEQCGLTSAAELIPAWLGSFPRRSGISPKQDQDERKIFGRLCVMRKAWSSSDYDLFEKNLNYSVSRWQIQPRAASASDRRASPNPPEELSALASALVRRCGLSTGEMQRLRAQDISTAGLLLRPSRLIPFGNGRDQLPKEVLDRFCEADRPTGYLFFSKSPRDHDKRLSRQTLNAAIQALHPKGTTITSLRKQHFREDFDRAWNINEFWSHLLNVHRMSADHIRRLICGRPRGRRSPKIIGFVNEVTVFPAPVPYFLAAICASGLCAPSSSRLLPGGERRLNEFRGLLGRYNVTIEWPASLFDELSRTGPKAGSTGRKPERALRLLYRLAWEHWYGGRGTKVSHARRTGRKGMWSAERDLVDRFALTNIRVVDMQGMGDWSAPLFEFQNRKRGFTVPLIEEMSGGQWRGKCRACWHPQRAELDRKISDVLYHKGKNRNLTPHQVKFIENLATGMTQKDAYLAAGYSVRDPDSSACHALSKIKKRVPELPKLLDSRDVMGVGSLLHRKEHLGLVEELTAVAERFSDGLSYQSLRGHAGLNPPVSGRGNTQRSHIARAPAAPLAKCQRALVNRLASLTCLPLIFYGLLLATGLEEQEFSAIWIQKQIGLTITDHEISVALNSLLGAQENTSGTISYPDRLISGFEKTPGGFLVHR